MVNSTLISARKYLLICLCMRVLFSFHLIYILHEMGRFLNAHSSRTFKMPSSKLSLLMMSSSKAHNLIDKFWIVNGGKTIKNQKSPPLYGVKLLNGFTNQLSHPIKWAANWFNMYQYTHQYTHRSKWFVDWCLIK